MNQPTSPSPPMRQHQPVMKVLQPVITASAYSINFLTSHDPAQPIRETVATPTPLSTATSSAINPTPLSSKYDRYGGPRPRHLLPPSHFVGMHNIDGRMVFIEAPNAGCWNCVGNHPYPKCQLRINGKFKNVFCRGKNYGLKNTAKRTCTRCAEDYRRAGQ